MSGLDPNVLAATGQAPGLDEPPPGALVAKIKQDDNDPAWSVVTYADGRVENRPTAEANALPMVTPEGPPLPPEGPPAPPAVGAGNPEPAVGDPARDAWLAEQTAQGFAPVGVFNPGDSLTPSGPMVYRGDSYRPAGTAPGTTLVPTGEGPGTLPAPQVDPGATVLPADDGTAPLGGKESTTVTENETLANPEDILQNTLGTANSQANALDEQAAGRQAAANDENRAMLAGNEARQQQVADDLHKAQIHTEEAQKAVNIIESTPIEQDFFKDAPGRQVAAWVALALSGFLQGATKGANPALNQMMQSLQHAQDRFIENQKADKASKLAQRAKAFGDARVAEASIRMQFGKLLDDHAKIQAKQVGLDALPPAVDAAAAKMRVDGAQQAQVVGMHVQRTTEHRFEQERQAGPVRQADRELQNLLGADYDKKHADAMDPKGANLGGMVQGAERLRKISDELEAIAKRNGGSLPNQNALSYSTFGAAGLASRMGSESAKDQLRAKQLLEEAKLAFKQTINIKSVDSENEGKNFNAMMDTGEASTTLQALRDKAAETNQRAVATASGFSRNPQGYIPFIERTMGSNPGVASNQAPQPKRSTGYRAEEPQAAAAAGPSPADTTGGGPAPSSPLAQSPSASAPGSPTAPSDQEDPVRLQTLQTLKSEAQRAGLNGDAITRIVRFESGGRADAKNPSGATGLIQWMPDVFRGMTKPPGYENVRHEDLKDLTAEEQAPLVMQYFKDKGVPANADVGEYYLAVAAPSLVGKPDSAVAYRKGSAAWTQNPAWRPADGGDITAGSIRARARSF